MNKKNNQNGQSTIEFIFAFAFCVSIVLVIFNSAMNYTTGYLIHYGTFMASRTFLTSELYAGVEGSQLTAIEKGVEEATAVFNTYRLDIFDVKNLVFKINKPTANTSSADYLTVGALTLFEANIDAVGQVAGQKKLELVSESFLGKEPVRTECAARTCFAITSSSDCGAGNLDITLFDDGC